MLYGLTLFSSARTSYFCFSVTIYKWICLIDYLEVLLEEGEFCGAPCLLSSWQYGVYITITVPIDVMTITRTCMYNNLEEQTKNFDRWLNWEIG